MLWNRITDSVNIKLSYERIRVIIMNALIIYLYCYNNNLWKHHNYINKHFKEIKNHKRKTFMNFQISPITYIAKYSYMIFGNVSYMRVYTWNLKIRYWNMIFWYFGIFEYPRIFQYPGIFKYRKGIFKYWRSIFKYPLDFDLNFVQETVFDYKSTMTPDRSGCCHFVLLSGIIEC